MTGDGLEDRLKKYAGYLEEEERRLDRIYQTAFEALHYCAPGSSIQSERSRECDVYDKKLKELRELKNKFYEIFPEYKSTEVSSKHP